MLLGDRRVLPPIVEPPAGLGNLLDDGGAASSNLGVGGSGTWGSGAGGSNFGLSSDSSKPALKPFTNFSSVDGLSDFFEIVTFAPGTSFGILFLLAFEIVL